MTTPTVDDAYLAEVEACRGDVQALLKEHGTRAHMGFLRLAVNDSLTYDQATRTGGPVGAMRVEKALDYEANAGLRDVVQWLMAIKEKRPTLSASDIIHLAGIEAAVAGGVVGAAFVPGRRESRVVPPQQRMLGYSAVVREGVPDSAKVVAAAKRCGLPVALMVALLGSHPFAAAWKDPQAYETAAKDDKGPMPIDNGFFRALLRGEQGTEHCAFLLTDPGLREWVEMYARDEKAFKEAFAEALTSASVLGQEGLRERQGRAGRAPGAASGVPPGRPGAQGAAGTDIAAYVAAGAIAVGAVGAGIWWLWRRRRMGRRGPFTGR